MAVARVAVDVPLAHLDRPFDYAVPARWAADTTPGVRVRVRFAGRSVAGLVLAVSDSSGHPGALAPIAQVVSPEPVLSPEIARLCRAVADRYAGTLADVLRLAVPPRHARVEARPSPEPAGPPAPPAPGRWSRHPAGTAYLAAIAAGRGPRAVWPALPGPGWPADIAVAVATALAAGRGALVIVPDARDVAAVDAAMTAELGEDRHVALTADLGPAERYRRWLAVRRGAVRAVVGTRSAMFAPVPDLGLAVCWDDGDDVHAEPRAPYPHVREVLALRGHAAGAAFLLGGLAVTAEGAALVESGWATLLAPDPAERTRLMPRVEAAGGDAALARDPVARSVRLPSQAWQAASQALAAGLPVLVQVPRRGYQPALSCARCRAPARCPACAGPLGRTSGSGTPACRWCGRAATDPTCPECGATGLRVTVVGSGRTAEEVGRAFPGAEVLTSDGSAGLAGVPAGARVVVATPGAEPPAGGGYGAVLLLDAWASLSRPDLRAAEETLRRWLAAAALARPAPAGGRVVVVADGGLPAVQALLRWRPEWYAARELADRRRLGFPPAVRMAAVTGSRPAVDAVVDQARLPPDAVVLGPVPVLDEGYAPGAGAGGGAPRVRALVRVPSGRGAPLAAALAAALAARSARKDADPVRVQLDPLDLL